MFHANELEVARQAGVSPAAVALALSDSPAISLEMRLRIRAIAESQGHRGPSIASDPCDPPVLTSTIGVVVPLMVNPFVDELLHSMQMEGEARGFMTAAVSSFSDPVREAAIVDRFVDMGVDGVFVLGSLQDGEALRRAGERCPLMVVSPNEVGGTVDTIMLDEAEAAELIMDHIWDRGWRSIVYVPEQLDAPQSWSNVRCHALARAAADRGIGFRSVPIGASIEAMTEREGLTWAAEMSTVVCHSGFAAIEIAQILRAHGFVPGQHLAVLAYDDSFLAGDSRNDLTTVEVNMEDYASTVVDTLIERTVCRESIGRNMMASPTLFPRGST